MVQPKFNPKFLFLSNGANNPAEFPSKVGAKNVNGIFSTGDWFPEAKTPGNPAFVAAYLKAYGGPRHRPGSAEAYAAGQVIEAVAKKIHRSTTRRSSRRSTPAAGRPSRASLRWNAVGEPQEATCSSSGSTASCIRSSRDDRAEQPTFPKPAWGSSAERERDVHQVVQAIILGLLVGGVYALMASGLTLVFGIMKVINVAQGALVILAAYLSYALFSHLHIDPFRLHPDRDAGDVPARRAVQLVFVRSLRGPRRAGALAARHLGARARDRGRAQRHLQDDLPRDASRRTPIVRGRRRLSGQRRRVLRLRRCRRRSSSLLSLLLTRTRFGRAVRATVQNPMAATLLGVDPTASRRSASGSACRLAAAAGAVYGVIFPFNPGSHYDLISRLLSIVVLGGLGSLGGAVVAALAMGVIEASSRSSSRRSGPRSPSSSCSSSSCSSGRKGSSASGSGLCEPRDGRRTRPRSPSFGASRIAFPFVVHAAWIVNIGVLTLMYAALATAVEPLLRLHRLHLARAGRVLRARRVRARRSVRALRNRLRVRPVLRAAARGHRRRLRLAADRVDRAAHAAHDVRHRDADAAVRRAAARVQPALDHERLVRASMLPSPTFPIGSYDRPFYLAMLARAGRRARALLAGARAASSA